MYLYLNKIFKILFSLFVFSVLILPTTNVFAFTQGYTLSGFGEILKGKNGQDAGWIKDKR